jgi:polyisoprenoid-binding protein YceI
MRTLLAILLVAFDVAAQPAELHYAIDAAGSELAWELPATLHTVHGKAPELSGRVVAVPGESGDWDVQARVVVKAAAMVTGNASRDRNMREKVLETDRYPEIVFEARRIRADLSRFRPGERFTAEAEGDLTVHGKAQPIRVPVDVLVQADAVILEGSFSLSWKQYGLNDPSFGIVTVRDPLKVHFRLRAVPE